MNILSLIGRTEPLFSEDLKSHEQMLANLISEARFLVIGGAGSIGQAVTREVFKRNPNVCIGTQADTLLPVRLL